MEVRVGEKTFNVNEINFDDFSKVISTNPDDATKNLILLSTGMNEEDFKKLTLREGVELINAVNEVNHLKSLENFQKKTN